MMNKIVKLMGTKSVQFIKNVQKPETKVYLGRWNLEKCEKKIHTKIDSSNEDHCGVCVNPKKYDDEEEEYLRYFLI